MPTYKIYIQNSGETMIARPGKRKPYDQIFRARRYVNTLLGVANKAVSAGLNLNSFILGFWSVGLIFAVYFCINFFAWNYSAGYFFIQP